MTNLTGKLLTLLTLILSISTYAFTSSADEGTPMETRNNQNMTHHTATKDTSTKYIKPSKEELKKRLTPLQYNVTQEEGTERPYKNEYWDNKRDGIYVDIVSGEPLFSSTDKYKSGTGWPSFTKPISDNAVVSKKDNKLFFSRTEIRSPIADSHLGHVFDDGPKPTGKRYCMNSSAMRFIPKEDLKTEGYSQLLKLF
jgi:peptide methionine sulfoxide reductase msrA/msrB